MEVLFISPNLTIDEPAKANEFFEACINEIENYLLEFSVIRNLKQISAAISKINEDTLLIIFNNKFDKYQDEVIKLINDAKEKEVRIWPIAINRECRQPMCNIDIKQSYDVFEQLRCRGLNEDYIGTIGVVFARKIISETLPTFFSNNNLLFVSHRRLDGEEITAKFCDQITNQARNDKSFRDVTNVEVGQAAQDVIDSALSQSDVLIFLHTERSSESIWIEKELIHAVLNNIPIIWVRIDNADETKLRIKPGAKPHIECNSEDFEDHKKLVEIIDGVLQKSFQLIMLSSISVYDRINAFKEFCRLEGIKLTEEDKRQLIYNLELPRKGYIYSQRNINHYIQYFGRRHKEDDVNKMIKFLENKKYNQYQLYDSAILLSDKVKIRKVNDEIISDNYDDFYYACQHYIKDNITLLNSEIIVSGAFPDCDEIYKQSLYDAVNIFSKEILKSGFTLTFGAHPTFQNIIFEIGKKFRPDDYQIAINMFISKYFQDKYDISVLTKAATVIQTDDIEHDLLKSLTEMRQKMIKRPTVKALICLGGIIRDGDTSQGIDEEIRIARANNIPVFIIGTVGGRSSQIASEYKKTSQWNELNEESESLNFSLALDLDYRNLASKCINVIQNNNKICER